MPTREGFTPPRFDEATRLRLLEAAKMGQSVATMARYAGVPRRSLRRWISTGEKQLAEWGRWRDWMDEVEADDDLEDDGTFPEPRTGPFAAFVVSLIQAQAESIHAPLAALNRAVAKGDTVAARWLLARLEPEQWGEARAKGEHDSGPGDASTSRETVARMFSRLG